ncbi:monooxygenase [Nannocystis punicea]|uniref:Monooxygenase n=1 Tax=Nannocystis punicea TaxID=2995304 RepID=A0ABY7H7N4_9BACT|nr:monooxygenase [Nannocystis poenicansa]WAS95261.1 monooxygenase [Nannocystis poenicansa]
MSRARSFVVTLVALTACNESSNSPTTGTDASTTAATDPGTAGTDASTDPPATTTSATSDEPTTTSPTGTTGGEAGPTYYRDIKAILDAKCATCHRPGDIAPFSLTTYEEAGMFAKILGPAIESRIMPPWPPGADCNQFAHDRDLTDDERELVLAWIAADAPEGDPNDAPPPPDDDAPPIAYDVQIGIPEPFTPPQGVADDYRCFLLDWPKDQETYATAFTIEPGAREIVHHVIAFIIPPDELADFEALDAADPGPGYPCYGGPGGEASPRAQWLGAWVPGASSGALPEGTGIRVKPGSKIAMQMHYHPNGAPIADQSTIMVRTAETVARPALLLPIAHPGWMVDAPAMTIPAGEADVVHSFTIDLGSVIQYLYKDEAIGVGKPLLAHMAGVHMHTRGARASLVVESGGAPEACLIDVPRWDFNWQGIYEFAAPLTVEPTDTVRLECHFDNSAGDSSLKWGEGTEDEMCLGMVYVSTDSP